MLISPEALGEQFPPLTQFEALEEANRCLFCYDAPCTHACPTHIQIPRFIKKIATGNLNGSARTIFDSNLLGATCARVCPVQELCEGACVLGPTHKPIAIGRPQRYTMDFAYARDLLPFPPAKTTGRRIAIIGAGPAGLSCAGELARRGNTVTVFDRRPMPGGLSTYGIIGLREPIDVALAEVALLERVGVSVKLGVELGRELSLNHLRADYDRIVLSVGLGYTPDLFIPGEQHVIDGLKYIEHSKVSASSLRVGNNVVIIGAGNTAIDCATIAKRLGARTVTMIYRRTGREMTAYRHEYEFALSEGIQFRFLTQPVRVLQENESVTALECIRMALGPEDSTGRAAPQPVPQSEFLLPADQVVKAIGQKRPALAELLNLETTGGYIAVNHRFETNVPGIWAIGDCIRSTGAASTVMAVQDGKLAAEAIHG